MELKGRVLDVAPSLPELREGRGDGAQLSPSRGLGLLQHLGSFQEGIMPLLRFLSAMARRL